MKLSVKHLSIVEVPGLNHGAIPIMRLLQYHCPDLLVGGYRLGDFDLKDIPSEKVHFSNVDRAQLAALGKSGE